MIYDQISRRTFLAKAVRYSAIPLSAFLFGHSIASQGSEKGKSTALIYATRYGATRETANWIKKALRSPVDMLDIEQISFADTFSGYDRYIIGSGIWIGGVHKSVLDFLETGKQQLDGKIAATYIVCGSDDSNAGGRQRIDGYFRTMHALLATPPPLSKAFGGRIIVEQLSDDDRNALVTFYKLYLQEQLISWDKTDPLKAEYFGKAIDMAIHA
ncbi:flavodoxin domain-containing protein [Chlorobium limicola]